MTPPVEHSHVGYQHLNVATSESTPLQPSRLSRLSRIAAQLRTWLSENLAAAKYVLLSPTLMVIALVYLVQGLSELADLAQEYFLKDALGASPAQVAEFNSAVNIPWMVKPFIGFVSDTIPLFGYRRRSYLFLASVVGVATWLMMCLRIKSRGGFLTIMMLNSAAGAVSDVVADSIVVERSNSESLSTSGSLQSLCWASMASGEIVTAYFSGSLVQQYGPKVVFGVTAVFPLIVAIASFFVTEEPVSVHAHRPADHKDDAAISEPSGASGQASSTWQDTRAVISQQCQLLATAMCRREILLPTIFLFAFNATPSSAAAMFFYQTEVLGFTPEFLGQVQLAAAISSLVGVLLYNAYFKHVRLRRIFSYGTFLVVLLQSTQLILVLRLNVAVGLDDHLFVLGSSVVLDVVANVLAMPVLVLSARLCPPGIEGTMFATLMSILNMGTAVSTGSGAVLTSWFGVTKTNFRGLPALVLICNLSLLVPLLLLPFVPASMDEEDKPEADRQQSLESEEGQELLAVEEGALGSGSHDVAIHHRAGPPVDTLGRKHSTAA